MEKQISKQRALELKRAAHHLNPVVIIGANELTPAVHAEIDQALNDHELIKIRVNARDRDHRQELTRQICDQHQAELIQTIGHTIVIYRKVEEA